MASVRGTNRQREYLVYIDAYIRLHRRSPSEAEIASHFGVSPPSAHQMVVTLEARGLIRRTPGEPRSIQVLAPPEQLSVPYGTADKRGRSSVDASPKPSAFEANYPHLSEWVKRRGWVVLGQTFDSRCAARAVWEGGVAWEGQEYYKDMDDLLRDADKGISRWQAQNE